MFSVDSNGVVRVIPPAGWGCMTVELLDAICEFLNEHNELLPLRGVNKHWNSVVNSLLERRTLNQWTKWLPLTDPFRIWPFPYLDLGHQIQDIRRQLDYENFSCHYDGNVTNPFPNNSVSLRYFAPSILAKSTDGFRRISLERENKLYKFLSYHGIYLTSLKLCVLEIPPLCFYLILQQVPNLKALTIDVSRSEMKHECVLKRKEQNEKKVSDFSISPCPQLTHLRILEHNTVLSTWILNLFSNQLISLEIEDIEMFPDDNQLDYCKTEAFSKLKMLKVYYPSTLRFLQFGRAFCNSLHSLSIQHCIEEAPITELIRFVNNFSENLVNFYLDIAHFGSEDEEFNEKNPSLAFPKLTTFSINQIHHERVLTMIKNNFRSMLKNLRTLKLMDFHFISGELNQVEAANLRETAAQFCANEGFWIMCPKLETIELYPKQYRRDFGVMVLKRNT
ncbi:unnamed protein product [Orchesella dallaii]|uniref:F-box domain-containing protein n=1 Tax=Orchesella dallaii TaxID=48710 RepID=A0ABP1RN58_9HEXA